MFGKVNKKALIGDLAKVATFNLLVHFLMHLRFNEPLFSEKFIYSLVFILLGFATYHFFLDSRVNAYFDIKEKYNAALPPNLGGWGANYNWRNKGINLKYAR